MALNLSTEALARSSARRPWVVIGVWVLILLVSFVLIFNFLGSALTNDSDFANTPESKRGRELLRDRLRGPERINEVVIVRSPTLTLDSSVFQGYVEKLYG